MALRISIPDFSLGNPIYVGATVTFFTVDGSGNKTTTKATLFDSATGTGTLTNPQILDSEGKFQKPVYIDTAVIGVITGLTIPDHDTGIITVPGKWRGDWVTARLYYAAELVRDATTTTDIYICEESHTSGVFATDLSAGKWSLFVRLSAIEADLGAGAVAYRYLFDSSVSMADPGAGDVRLNNATLSAVTQIAVSALAADAGNPDVSAFVVTWDDSTHSPRGTIIIRLSGTLATFAIYSINGAITDNGTWLQIPVAHVASNGTLADTDKLFIHFLRSGDDGAGVGDMLAANNLSDVADVPTSRANLGVPPATRAINTGAGLSGGGDLSADRTLIVATGGVAAAMLAADAKKLNALPQAIKTATPYTVAAGDVGTMLIANLGSAITFGLTAAATLGAGYVAYAKNINDGDLTLDPAGAETIDGVATLVLKKGEWTKFWTEGTAWRSLGAMAVSGGGAWDLLERTSLSGSATAFTAGDWTLYDEVQILIEHLVSNVAADDWLIQFSVDNGTSWLTADYDWVVQAKDSGGTARDEVSSVDSGIQLNGSDIIGPEGGANSHFLLHIVGMFDDGLASEGAMSWNGGHRSNVAAEWTQVVGSGRRNTAGELINAARIVRRGASATLSGNASVWGRRRS